MAQDELEREEERELRAIPLAVVIIGRRGAKEAGESRHRADTIAAGTAEPSSEPVPECAHTLDRLVDRLARQTIRGRRAGQLALQHQEERTEVEHKQRGVGRRGAGRARRRRRRGPAGAAAGVSETRLKAPELDDPLGWSLWLRSRRGFFGVPGGVRPVVHAPARVSPGVFPGELEADTDGGEPGLEGLRRRLIAVGRHTSASVPAQETAMSTLAGWLSVALHAPPLSSAYRLSTRPACGASSWNCCRAG